MILDITLEIESGDDILYVDVETRSFENSTGIGYYEWWGERCYDKGETVWDMEECTWSKSVYSDDENILIGEYIEDNWLNIEEKINDLARRLVHSNY